MPRNSQPSLNRANTSSVSVCWEGERSQQHPSFTQPAACPRDKWVPCPPAASASQGSLPLRVQHSWLVSDRFAITLAYVLPQFLLRAWPCPCASLPGCPWAGVAPSLSWSSPTWRFRWVLCCQHPRLVLHGCVGSLREKHQTTQQCQNLPSKQQSKAGLGFCSPVGLRSLSVGPAAAAGDLQPGSESPVHMCARERAGGAQRGLQMHLGAGSVVCSQFN